MFIDQQNMFSDEQDLSQAIGDAASTNVIDTGADDSDVGLGERTYVAFHVTEDFVGVGATVRIRIQTDNDEAFGSAKTLYDSGAVAIADVNAGVAPVAMPLGGERYLRVLYSIGGATTTAGKMSAFIAKDIQRNKAFPIGHS